MNVPKPRKLVPAKKASSKTTKKSSKHKAVAPRVNPLDDPAALTRPLTPRLLDQQVRANTDLYAAPAEAEIAGQRRVSGQMQANVPVWFQQYQDALKQSTQAGGAATLAATGIQQNAVNTTAQLSAQDNAAQLAAMQADATSRGALVDPKVAAEMSQGLLARRAAGDAQTALTAGLGAAQVGYRSGQEGVAAGQRLSAQLGEAQRGRNIDKAAGELATKKGQFAVTNRQKLIDSEHTKQIENKAFKLNVEKAAADASNDAASIAVRRAATKATSKTAAAGRRTSERNTLRRLQSSERTTDKQLQNTNTQKALDREAAKERAKISAGGGGRVTPAERRRRTDAVNDATDTRDKAVSRAKAILADPTIAAIPGAPSAKVRRGLETAYPKAPKEVIDYALAAALGSKAGVTKKGQPSAAARFYAYLRDLSSGRRSK